MRKDIEADPDLEVDRNAPKDFITDQEMEKRFPELAEVERRDPGEAVRAPEPVEDSAQLHRSGLGHFEDALAHLHSGARQLSGARAPKCSLEFRWFWTIRNIRWNSPIRRSIRNGTAPIAA